MGQPIGLSAFNGAPGEIRTPDHQVRSEVGFYYVVLRKTHNSVISITYQALKAGTTHAPILCSKSLHVDFMNLT